MQQWQDRLRIVTATIVATVFLAVALPSSAAKPPRRLQVQSENRIVRVRNATAMGQIVLVGHEIAEFGGAPLYRRVFREGNADGSGNVEFDLERDLAEVSFWVALDVSTGGYGATAHTTTRLREGELHGHAFRKDSAGKLKHVELPFDYVYTVVVRPGVGAWEAVAGDGAEGDDDQRLDGKIEIKPARLRKRKDAGSPSLDEYRSGDVLAVFAPRQMGYLIVEVKP